MENKNAEMQDIFQKLTEKNKDIVILVAQSMKIAQDTTTHPHLVSEKQSGETKKK